MTDTIEQRTLLTETVDKLFRTMMETDLSEAARSALEMGKLPLDLWSLVEENGINSVFIPESAGGFGGNWLDAFVILNCSGFYSVPLPIAETLLAQRLLVQADIPVPSGAIAIAAQTTIEPAQGTAGAWTITGSAAAVPWGNAAEHILVACEHAGSAKIALVAAATATIGESGHSIAREPFADLQFSDATVLGFGDVSENIFHLCALIRAAQIAGALNAALRLSVQYANERSQFGKPIAKFQAIQHALAQLADEAAAVNCAAMAACRAADVGNASFEIGAAKLRANRAIGIATSIAHQVHGAIGFTKEHKLHFATQRLWSWRSEYGNDRYWAAQVGALVAQRGAANFWFDLTERGDRAG